MIKITAEQIEKAISDCDKKIENHENSITESKNKIADLKVEKDKWQKLKELDLASLVNSLSNLGGGGEKKKFVKEIPNGFSKFLELIAVDMITKANKPLHINQILKEVDKKFDYKKPVSEIDPKRKYSTAYSALSISEKVESTGDRSGMWRLKLKKASK